MASVFSGRGRRDRSAKHPSCGARNLLSAWSAGKIRPLRQQILLLSATGGGRLCRPALSSCLGYKKYRHHVNGVCILWQGQKGSKCKAPLLRCPNFAFCLERRQNSTAAPTNPPFIRHRRRSDLLPGTRFWRGADRLLKGFI